MRFGVCCDSSHFAEIKKAGYDYGEMNLSALAALSEEDFLRVKAEVEASGIAAEAFNCFFPGTTRLTGPDVDFDAIEAYAKSALRRASLLGGKIAVLGSGGSRRIPEDVDRSIAGAQFLRVLQICGKAAAENGMTVALEPLNKLETNLVNTVEEGAAFIRAAGEPGARLLADFYHIFRENEPVCHLKNAADILVHVHLARPNADRKMPQDEDMDTLRTWAETLAAAGYEGRLSLEGGFDDFVPVINRTRPMLDVFQLHM